MRRDKRPGPKMGPRAGWLAALLVTTVSAGALGQELIVSADPATTSALDAAQVVSLSLSGFAGPSVVVTQSLVSNSVMQQDVFSTALIDQSFQNDTGIVNANQDVGNFNNQANVRAIVLLQSGSQAQLPEIDVLTTTTNNVSAAMGGGAEDRIQHSFQGTKGIVGVNQSAGNLNQQANILSISAGSVVGSVAVSIPDTTLGDVASGNQILLDPTRSHVDSLTDSFGGFTGIAQVTQSAGDLNVVRNALSLSVISMTVP
jgi:hypothetical protein